MGTSLALKIDTPCATLPDRELDLPALAARQAGTQRRIFCLSLCIPCVLCGHNDTRIPWEHR